MASSSLVSTPATFDLVLYRGDTLSLAINLKNSDGSNYVLSGTAGNWTPAMNIETEDGVAVYQGAIKSSPIPADGTKIIVSTTSKLELVIGTDTTKYLVPGITYIYDIQVTSSTENITLLKGTITVEGDVTQ